MKRISIIIPMYNVEKYIERCLESVVKQIDENYDEIIIVDDGSTDKSLSICQDYQKKHKNVKIIKIKNSGPSTARNTRN